jgi:hypothetical protein
MGFTCHMDTTWWFDVTWHSSTLDDDIWPWEALLHPWDAWRHNMCGLIMTYLYDLSLLRLFWGVSPTFSIYHCSFTQMMWTNVLGAPKSFSHYHISSHLWERALEKFWSTFFVSWDLKRNFREGLLVDAFLCLDG